MRKNTQTLSFLGRGSMFNVKEGNTSAYWKSPDGKNMLLIDCGCTVFSKINKLNLLDDVEYLVIAITHMHTDHIGSLSDLLLYCRYCKPDMRVVVISNINIRHYLYDYFRVTGTMLDGKRIYYKAIVDPTIIYSHNKYLFNISFIKDITHVVPIGLNKVYSSGILIEFPDKVIYYSGDTMKIPYGRLDLDNIDEIYVDCAVRDHSPGSEDPYPHYNLYNMVKDLNNRWYPLDKVYAMHLDCDGVIDQCNLMRIKIVQTEDL